MCGIAGILALNNAALELQHRVGLMTDAMSHRGPDADGFFVANNRIALGHRRLSIIDLSVGANQPLFDSQNRYVIIFNGEIYNFKEVKALIPDYPYSTASDTEVILAAYIKWGERCLEYLNGMFAFAIWDKQTERLFIARDRLGIKPLYFFKDENYLIFASELRAILASGLVKKEISEQGLADYLSFQSAICPNTILQNVYQLPPATYLLVQNGNATEHCYWQIATPTKTKSIKNRDEIKAEIKELLYASIERRMISDVPLGAFLSGGIDSSAIVGIMSHFSPQPVNTFSIVFDEQEFDEREYSRIIAEKFKTNHTELSLSANSFLQALPQALNCMDNPSCDGLNTYVVSKLTKEAGVTVALTGLGGDELFAGYRQFKNWHRSKRFGWYHIPKSLRVIALALFALVFENETHKDRLRNIGLSNGTIAHTYPYFRQVFSDSLIKQLTHIKQYKNTITDCLVAKKGTNQLPLLSQYSVGELLGYTLNVLIKDTDQFSMASSIELREPFFDYKLVEYLLQVPDEYKNTGQPKNILVEALGDLLPTAIVNRPKKGFAFPWETWMRTDLRAFCTEKIQSIACRPLFKEQEVLAAWELFLQNPKKIAWAQMWQLVVLEHWLQKNID